MDKQSINTFLMTNGKNFPEEEMSNIRSKLETVSDENYSILLGMEFKSPTTVLLISIFCGSLGIDRFYLGDTGMGLGKILTAGGCGIWTIIDWFNVQKATRQKNFIKLESFLASC